jgi:hypothetical protein
MYSFRQFLHHEALSPIRPTDRLVYSSRPTFDRHFRVAQTPDSTARTTADIKPQGMWYSIGTAWKDYADDAGLRVGSSVYRVTLTMSRILVVRPEDLSALNRQYGKPWRVEGFDLGRKIDWAKVAQTYAGVEFNPYNKWADEVDEDSLWYQGIDVPSGCVWDSAAIASVEALTS